MVDNTSTAEDERNREMDNVGFIPVLLERTANMYTSLYIYIYILHRAKGP